MAAVKLFPLLHTSVPVGYYGIEIVQHHSGVVYLLAAKYKLLRAQ